MSLTLVPIKLDTANAFVLRHHRHHKPVQGHKFSVGVATDDGRLVGAAIIGRPVSRGSDDGFTAEVTRVCTDGTRNACSILYGAAARAAKAMGYRNVQTYILDEEDGASLRASGYQPVATTAGGRWVRSEGTARRDDQPNGPKQRWERRLAPHPPFSVLDTGDTDSGQEPDTIWGSA